MADNTQSSADAGSEPIVHGGLKPQHIKLMAGIPIGIAIAHAVRVSARDYADPGRSTAGFRVVRQRAGGER